MMVRNTACTVYIGNLDEKVTERVLYEILIQAGYLVDLHIPLDKESKNHKGFAFAEYETEEVANYAVRLFSGLVRLHNKNLKFAMSGQDKPSNKSAISAASKPISPPSRKPPLSGDRCEDSSQESTPSMSNSREAYEKHSKPYTHYHYAAGNSVPRGLENSNYEFGRRVFGAMLNGVSPTAGRSPLGHTFY